MLLSCADTCGVGSSVRDAQERLDRIAGESAVDGCGSKLHNLEFWSLKMSVRTN